MGSGDQSLRGCYRTCLALVEKHRLRSVAFCGVGTGIFGFPLVRATHIALDEVRAWLEALAKRKVDAAEAKAAATAEADGGDAGKAEGAAEEGAAAPAEQPYTIDDVDRIIFCTFRPVEMECYEKMTPAYFPAEGFPAAAYTKEDGDDDFNKPDPPKPDYSSYGSAGGGRAGGGWW